MENINLLFKDELWLDFRIYECNSHRLVVGGGENLTYYHEFELIFELPYVICGAVELKTSPNKYEFFKILDGEDASQFNLKHRVIEGNTLFQIVGDDDTMTIAAVSVEFRRRRVFYYERKDLKDDEVLAYWLK